MLVIIISSVSAHRHIHFDLAPADTGRTLTIDAAQSSLLHRRGAKTVRGFGIKTHVRRSGPVKGSGLFALALALALYYTSMGLLIGRLSPLFADG